MAISRMLAALTLVLFSVTAFGATYESGEGTFTDTRRGLVWVADEAFPVTAGLSNQPLMSREDALDFIAAMNRGLIPNFGFKNWRLANSGELKQLYLEASAGDSGLTFRLATLGSWLRKQDVPMPGRGGWSARGRYATAADPVYIWPVRNLTVPEGFSSAVIFATNSINIERGSTINGDVVANVDSPGPTLFGTVELSVKAAGNSSTTINGTAKAKAIEVARKATINGDAFVDSLSGTGTINGTIFDFPDPAVFDAPPAFQLAAVRDEAQDVLVLAGQTVVLSAGSYRDIQITPLGILELAGGQYDIRSITGGQNSKVTFSAASNVRVEGRLVLGQDSTIGPATGASVDASDLVVYAGAANPQPDEINAAVLIGKNSFIDVNIYAANGTIAIKSDATANGAFLARDVQVGANSILTLATIFRNRSPVAIPLSVATEGDMNLLITLDAVDPENDPLVFSIISALGEDNGALIDPETLLEITTFPYDLPGDQVIYDPDTGNDLEDNFTFGATDPSGNTGTANVRINASEAPANPPAVATVLANSGEAETLQNTSVQIELSAEAPCDAFVNGECTSGVSVSFSVGTACDPDCDDPGLGSLSDLIQGAGPVQRIATLQYNPFLNQTGVDSFEFEACGTIETALTCNRATVTVEIFGPSAAPPFVAQDQLITTAVDQSVVITFTTGAPGEGDTGEGPAASPGYDFAVSALPGQGNFSPRLAATTIGASVAGSVSDSNGDGLGDGATGGSTTTVDFETPSLGAADRQTINPFVNSGFTFVTEGTCSGFSGEVGLSKNVGTGTSACVPPANSDQMLATATSGSGSVGLSGFAIRATFGSTIPAGSQVSAEFQTADGTPIRIRLFDSADQLVGSASATASPGIGICPGNSGPTLRARGTVTATASSAASYAILDLNASTCGLVFTVDDFEVTTPGSLPLLVSAGVNGSGGPGTAGTRRIHAEFDVANLSGTIDSATVVFTTEKGTTDSIHTIFYTGSNPGDGFLTASDFEAPAGALPGVMPVNNADPAGTVGTYSTDVTSRLQAAIDNDFSFFQVQGRVEEARWLKDPAARRGLQVRTTAPGNLTDPCTAISGPPATIGGPPPGPCSPQLIVTTGSQSFKVLTLPFNGTLKDGATALSCTFVSDPRITNKCATPISISSNNLTYTPNLGFQGNDGFQFQALQGAATAIGNIGITVLGSCADNVSFCDNGRP